VTAPADWDRVIDSPLGVGVEVDNIVCVFGID